MSNVSGVHKTIKYFQLVYIHCVFNEKFLISNFWILMVIKYYYFFWNNITQQNR